MARFEYHLQTQSRRGMAGFLLTFTDPVSGTNAMNVLFAANFDYMTIDGSQAMVWFVPTHLRRQKSARRTIEKLLGPALT